MRKLSSIFLILLLYLGCTLVLKAQYSFEAQLTQVIRESGKLDVDVGIRSTGSSFVLATSTFLFNYNTAGLGSPIKVAANDGPWDYNTDLDYLDVSLNNGSGFAGLIVLFGGGFDNNGAVVPSTFTRIGTVQFTILNSSQSSGLVWRGIGTVTQVARLSNPGVYLGGQTPILGTFLDPTNAPLPTQLASFTASVVRDKFVLAQNYPNPFNPSTVIEFVVPQSGFATMKVCNVLGQEVATVFEGNAQAGKINVVRFSATGRRLDSSSGSGSNLPGGMYFYTLKSAGKTETKRMLLVK
jgi:hypothetical protein